MTIDDTLNTVCSIAMSSHPGTSPDAAAYAYDALTENELIERMEREKADFDQNADAFARLRMEPVERAGHAARSWHEWVTDRMAYAAIRLRAEQHRIRRMLDDNVLDSANQLIEEAQQPHAFQWKDDELHPARHRPTLAMRAVSKVEHFGRVFQEVIAPLLDNATFLVTALGAEQDRVLISPDDDLAHLDVVQIELLSFIAKQGTSAALIQMILHKVQQPDHDAEPRDGYSTRTIRGHLKALGELGLIERTKGERSPWRVTPAGIEANARYRTIGG